MPRIRRKSRTDRVREAAASLGGRMSRRPDLSHPRKRDVAIGAAVAGGAGAVYAVKRKRSSAGNPPEYEGQTVAAPPSPFPSAPMPVA